MVRVERGRVGGYWLAVAPEAINIAEVVESLSGPVFPFPCLADSAGAERCRQCPGVGACPARAALASASAAAYGALKSLSLADVLDPASDPFATPDPAPWTSASPRPRSGLPAAGGAARARRVT